MGPKLTALEKMAYASQTIVTVAVCLARFSILLFYARIFTNRAFRIPVYLMYTLNGLWGIGFTLTYLVQCVPPSELWEVQQSKRQHCIGDSVNYYYAVSTIILDVIVLAMPWPIVWRLQMAAKQKIAVLGIFMLGVMKANVINRLGSDDEAPLFYWTVPECCLSVVCACLPLLRPIFQGMSPESLFGSIRSVFSLASSVGSEGSNKRSDHSNPYRAKHGQDAMASTVAFRKISDEASTLSAQCKSERVEQVELQDLERCDGAIKVHKEIQPDEAHKG
ncbi:MAG: hypothetical protein Q9187_004642 [Circinaria calcarea]